MDGIREYVSAAELCQFLNMGAENVRRLGKEGIVVKAGRGKFRFLESVKGYCKYLQDRMPSNRSGDFDIDVFNAKEEKIKWEAINAKEKSIKGRAILVNEVRSQMKDECVVYFVKLINGIDGLNLDNDSKRNIAEWLEAGLEEVKLEVESKKEN